MKKYLLLLLPILFISSCQEIDQHKPVLTNSKKKQPIVIVNRNRHLNIAEFWIDNLKKPDDIIMTDKDIKAFNDEVAYQQKQLTYFRDINDYYGASWIKAGIETMLKGITLQTKYFEDGKRIPSSFYSQIRSDIALSLLSNEKIKTRYAMTTNYTNQRLIPTDLALLKRKNQIYFDRNQNSALDIATPIAILYSTPDQKWHYGIAPTSSGWVKDGDIAFGDKKEIQEYIDAKKFIITTSPKSAVMIAGKYHDYLRMGVKLPSILTLDNMTMVLIPTKDEDGSLILSNATIKTSDTHKGYLSYTPRNILIQAFKFIHAPYGWGGMYGEQDCSKFIQEVYATVGVRLPRNSASQSAIGSAHLELSNLRKRDKKDRLENIATVGSTIIHLKGHIVLYIGEYRGDPYIIHTVWGESQRHFALARTAVTSLSFNNYIDKIDRATIIEK